MFKVSNKDNRTTPVSIVNFEHLITGRDILFQAVKSHRTAGIYLLKINNVISRAMYEI